MAEMARVLSPGGRVAIVEPDFDALMIDSDDPSSGAESDHWFIAQPGYRSPAYDGYLSMRDLNRSRCWLWLV